MKGKFEKLWKDLRCNNPSKNETHINLSSNGCCQIASSETFILLEDKVNKLEEVISYALSQESQNYGMVEEEAIQFRLRKIVSILKESLDD